MPYEERYMPELPHFHDFTLMFKVQQIHSPYVFYGAATLLVAYLLYMIVRGRKGERSGSDDREPML